MNDLKMILTDGTALSIDAFGLPMHAVTTCANEDELLSIWKQLTPFNLGTVEIQQDGVTVFKFAGGQLDGVQTVTNGNGSMTVHFYMSGVRLETGTDTDQEYVTAAKIMLGEEEVQPDVLPEGEEA